jgi:chitodextrinase
MLRSSRATAQLFGCLVAALVALSAPAIASAAAPSVVGSVSDANVDLSGVTAVAVSRSYAYAASGYGGELTAIDIANPAGPLITGSAAPAALPTANSMMGASNVVVAGGYAFVVARNSNGGSYPNYTNDNGAGNSLTVFDVHNPAQPTYVGQVYSDTKLFGAYGIAVSGRYAYVAYQGVIVGSPSTPRTSKGGFSVIDITDPSGPTIVGNLDNNNLTGSNTNALSGADGVGVSGNDAYVAAWGKNAITVIDISNPASPTIVTSLVDPTHLNEPSDVAVSGSHLFVSDYGSAGVTAVDISNPTSPSVAGYTSATQLAGAYRIKVAGSYAYVAGSISNTLATVNVSNPAAPVLTNAFVTDARHLNSVIGLDVVPGGRYVVATSPRLSNETKTVYPPYPTQPGGPTNTGTVSVIDLDPNPVNVAITTPGNHATYAQGQPVSAAYACSPGGAVGLSSCTGPVPSGQAIDTSTPGSHSFTVSGTDVWGQTGSATVTYTVIGKPAAAFSESPATPTVRTSVSFDGSGSSDPNPGATITGYSWSFGDGRTGSGARTRHAYARAGTYTVTLTVTDSLGQRGSVQHTVKVRAARPRFSYVRQLSRRWTEPGTPTVARLPVGTVFWFTLNTKAKLTFTFYRVSSGRKAGHRCVAPTRQNRHHAACVRKVRVGTLKLAGAKGGNAVRFRGRIGRHRLAPGTYQVVITATANGLSSHRTLTFTIVR